MDQTVENDIQHNPSIMGVDFGCNDMLYFVAEMS